MSILDYERDTDERATEQVLFRLTPRDRERLRTVARAREMTEVMMFRLWLRREEAELQVSKQAA
jgi:hypothetical protein